MNVVRFVHRYRIYMDDCEVEEGFADEVCRLLISTENPRIHSFQLLAEPNWSQTHVVALTATMGGGGSGSQSHQQSLGIISLPEAGKDSLSPTPTKTKVDAGYFYAINGRSYIIRDAAKRESICVEESINPYASENICSVYQEDNPTHWKTKGPIEVTVTRTPCTRVEGAELLNTRACFAPLKADSCKFSQYHTIFII
jgi:hypothetical protein